MSVAARNPETESDLGYDPRPGLMRWRGTPIPAVKDPLKATPERCAIAGRVWWNGPPWTVLRNASRYLWHVMDYGRDEDIAFARDDVPDALWCRALADARPGHLSRGSYVLWCCVFGLMTGDDVCDWPGDAHLKDFRPTAGDGRERMYERAAAHHRRAGGRQTAVAEIASRPRRRRSP